VLSLAARVAVTALLLVWLFRHAGGFGPVLTAIRAARAERIAAAFLVTLIVQAAIAHRLRLLAEAQGVGLGTRDVMEINLVTLFYGLFLPGGGITAIVIRLYRLTRADRRYTATLAAIVCDRLLATATLCVAGLMFWLLDGPQRSQQALVVLVVASAAAALALSPMFHSSPARWISLVASRLPLVRGLWPRIAEALAVFRAIPLRGQIGLAALSLGAHVLGIGVYFLLARAMGVDAPFMALGWMRSTATLVAILPFSVSGLGLREGAMVALLGQRGVPGHAALAYSLLVFGVTILSVGLVGGLIEAVRWLRPRRTV
jgi:hypothetical protein